MKLINIGFGNMVSASRLIAIVSPESAPIKRMIQEARERGVLIDGARTENLAQALYFKHSHPYAPSLPALMRLITIGSCRRRYGPEIAIITMTEDTSLSM